MKTIGRWLILFMIFAILLFPIWMMVSNSFSPIRGFMRSPPTLLPTTFTLDNYRQLLSMKELPRWILNTCILAAILVPGGVIITGAAGYAFSFSSSRWIRRLFWVFMVPIFVSGYVLLIPKMRIIGMVGLHSLPAVVSMSLFWSTGMFLFRNYFRTIPKEIVESSRIDGAGEWRVLLQVVLPMSRPMIGAAIVFLGMGVLGDYIWQMLNLLAKDTQTYLVGLMASTINVSVVKNVGYDLTVGTMLFIPYLVLFSVSSRYFIKGLTAGALKA